MNDTTVEKIEFGAGDVPMRKASERGLSDTMASLICAATAAAVAEERERCAKIAEDAHARMPQGLSEMAVEACNAYNQVGRKIARKIREGK